MLKLKNDRYRNARGGTAHFCDIVCARCGSFVLLYQKDGHGGLHRLYLNRIFLPEELAALQRLPHIRQPSDLAPLKCSACGSMIGTPMRHSEGRLAFRLVVGSFVKRGRRK